MATATCSAFHEIATRQERSIYCVYNKWSDPLPNCEPSKFAKFYYFS